MIKGGRERRGKERREEELAGKSWGQRSRKPTRTAAAVLHCLESGDVGDAVGEISLKVHAVEDTARANTHTPTHVHTHTGIGNTAKRSVRGLYHLQGTRTKGDCQQQVCTL